MNIRIPGWASIAIVLSVLTSCGAFKENFAPRNIAREYSASGVTLRPNHKIWIKDSEETILQSFLKEEEVLFANTEGKTTHAEIKVSIFIYENLQHTILIDSLHRFVSIDKEHLKTRWIYYHIPFKTPTQPVFYVRILTHDLFRNAIHEHTDVVYNQPYINKNTVLLTSENPFLNAGGIVTSTDSVLLTFSDIIDHNKKVKIAYFDDEIPLAPPPFNVKNMTDLIVKPKTVMQFSSDSLYALQFKKPGMYQLLSDTAKVEGFCMFNFGDNFPEFKTPSELIEPLRYLVSKKEYQQLVSYANPKIGVDSLWLSFSKEPDKAREQIRVFYNRAKLANVYFSSFTPGWRTDRGMIFIIFGAPTSVQVMEDKEVWTYGSRLAVRSLEFEFYKISNPFSSNHYLLKRQLKYKTYYYRAVESWRNGMVYQYAR